MTIQLPQLPYAENALEPIISEKTIQFHYGKHHQAYVQKTNELIERTDLKDKTLEEIVLYAASDSVYTTLFNNAAQAWNHSFFWNSLKPINEKKEISEKLMKLIVQDFGSVENLKKELIQKGLAQFGSGWVWLVYENEHLKVISTSNAETPLTSGSQVPLLTIDVWEHAYYLDEQNRRSDYLSNLVEQLLNWTFADQNLPTTAERG
ncbi:MAG: superoxide dismutase [Alphaproteobacteria bacterium]|nr:superoxide dismutase [Alphaproteobacteria bacterium]MBR3912984.1 superoxide dismutase [Alphaproteobacteria bacterium]